SLSLNISQQWIRLLSEKKNKRCNKQLMYILKNTNQKWKKSMKDLLQELSYVLLDLFCDQEILLL
ncbi:MAC/Perforin domain protein, partial [Chlamydia psittaci 84-8471/1]